jgi:pimeloyl-ACP methyl ester carboxylesterase
LEPLQTASSIDGQVKELLNILTKHATFPVCMIGHSWGAWLIYIFAARHPSLVKKLILVGSAAFEENHAKKVRETRMERLSEDERHELESVESSINRQGIKIKPEDLIRFEHLICKADSFAPLTVTSEIIRFQPRIFQNVWAEAEVLRKSGALLKIGKQIQCPVIAIHGTFDPHPIEGVNGPLSQVIQDLRCIALEQCGHNPWLEKYARDRFFEILYKEIQ